MPATFRNRASQPLTSTRFTAAGSPAAGWHALTIGWLVPTPYRLGIAPVPASGTAPPSPVQKGVTHMQPFLAQAQGSRPRQEDAAAWWTTSDGALWAAVADGLGGHPQGDRASHTALAALQTASGPLPPDPTMALLALVDHVHTAVAALSTPTDPRPPGTTLLWVVCLPDRIHLVSVGDSRAWLVQGGHATAWNEPMRDAHGHLLSAMGVAVPKVDLETVPWDASDWVILATDGADALTPDGWVRVTCQPDPAKAAIHLLAQAAALEDNATVLAIHDPLHPTRRMPHD